MRNLLTQLLAIGPELAAFIFSTALLQPRTAYAITQNAVPAPNLDLSQLGRVALAGDFDSISLYQYEGQSQGGSSNGSQALLARYPNGAFQTLGMTDAYIETMCSFVTPDGTLQGVVIGGNFTSFGGTEAQAIALFNPDSGDITPLTGLSGKVSALFCDQKSGIVYVGGSFTAGNSTNAMAWVTGWTNLPFAGFNGPVTSITRNAAGNIVFGGSFTGLGNTTTPNDPDVQAINLFSGNISASGTTSRDGFDDPSSIICKTGSEDGSGNTWLLEEDTAGWWQGYYAFGFNPTKLRLYNTQQDGYGTKTFYFENLNSGGIMNLEYSDADGNNHSCSARCPLAANSTAQDFHFAPPVGMDSFRINVVDWYGSGGGLAGIEMFQDDMYSFAINDFNEPQCDGVSNGSSSTVSPSNGTWARMNNNGNTSSDYLSAYLTDASQFADNISVTFTPDLRQSGNYSITVYTPGCIQDDTCDTRGQVNLTGSMTSSDPPFTTSFFQTNYYDKFDQIFYGYVDVDGGNFRPSVTLSPSEGQAVPLTVVAQRVRFELLNSTSGLRGIYEYKPNQATLDTDFSTSAINAAGHNLASGAVVNAVITSGDRIFVAGNFSGDGIENVMSVDTQANPLPGGGLNREVQTIFQNASMLYMGGNFSNTADNSVEGLNNVAGFDVDSSAWFALGAGVDGPVFDIVPLDLNVTQGDLQSCIALTGAFKSVNEFDGNAAFDATGFAIWIPSRNNWLQNIADVSIAINGDLVAYVDVPNHERLYSGSISSQAQGFSDAVELTGSGQSLQGLGIKLQASSSSSMKKRALDTSADSNSTGVYNGLYYGDNGLNITVLGGSFSADASNGSTVENLLFINNTGSSQTISGVTGLDSSSIFVAMDTINTLLFAGGAVTGSIRGNSAGGLAVIDLATGDYASPQPPALAGDNVIVNAVATQPSNSRVFVGGNFQTAGSLPCQTLCYYDTDAQQWDTPGSGLSGTVNSMVWTSKNQLIIAGNLTVGDNTTTMASYDAKKQTFASYASTPSTFGTILSLSAADGSYDSWWASGRMSTDDSTFLAKYTSSSGWTLVPGLQSTSTIRGLQPMSVKSSHSSSDLMPSSQVLMLTGNLAIPSFGNCSAALFNGTDFTPYILTSSSSSPGQQGSLAQMFVSNPQNLMSGGGHHLALGLVVLVGLAIALGLIFLLVIVGILLERQRRKKEGYIPLNRGRGGGAGNLSRIPPETLLGRLQEKDSPPKL